MNPSLRHPAALLVLAPLLAWPAQAQPDADGLTLVGRLNPELGRMYSDVWTHVGPDGREYALLGSWIDGGINVIDVTDDQPVLEEHVPMNGDGSDVEGYGHYAYVTSNVSPTLIIDLSDPTNPEPVGTFGQNHHTLSIADGYLYGNGNGGVYIYDLADPANPVQVGQYAQGGYVHDVLVRNDTMYTAGILGNGINIVDVSDKTSPTRIDGFNYPGSGAHNICSDPSGAYLYVGDEIGTGRWTRIFDVRDPHNVEQVGEIIVDPNTNVHNCHTKDGLLYLAHWNLGVWVFDITDPVNPVQYAYYETISDPEVGSIWTMNPHLPSGKILASDAFTGLLVFRLDNPPVANEPDPEAPAGVTLAPVAPNPFSAAATIRFTLDAPAEVCLAVHDARGREVAVLLDGPRSAGAHEVSFRAADLPSGVYLIRLDAAGQTLTQRVTLLR